ncbi:LysR family transcriptional regulator [Granulosicoccus sp. 3-233]|uniref:LysR family transcriptional regulator n=1 Tax=Granulosicoccus sp. 3-233 TaxID=3417969 RepID=UPI003D324D31
MVWRYTRYDHPPLYKPVSDKKETHPSVDFRQLVYLLRTAEHGSITRAAEALNIAQPTLTKAIGLLEHRLGVPLFERLPRGVQPTVFGERLLEHARLVEVQLEDAVRDLDTLREGGVGKVRIGAGPSWLRQHLPETIAQVTAERPGIEVHVTGGFDQSLLQGLASGDLDFVVAETALAENREAFAVEVLTEDDLVVWCRARHPLLKAARVSLQDLIEQSWALPPERTFARQKFDARLMAAGLPQPDRVTESDSLAFILAMVAASDCLTYTGSAARWVPNFASLVALDVPDIKVSRSAGIITRSRSLPSSATEFVMHRLRDYCRQHPVN